MAAGWVQLDGLKLILGELSALTQHRGRDTELSNVVQRARVFQCLQSILRHRHGLTDQNCCARNSLTMTAGVRILCFHGLHQSANRGVVRLLFGRELSHRPASNKQRQQTKSQGQGTYLRPQNR